MNKNISFEEAFKELKEIVSKLSDGSVGLDQSIIDYERGLMLLKTCRKKLQHAELKLKTIHDSSDGYSNMSTSTPISVQDK